MAARARTITRFCDDAGLQSEDHIDMAEFIVAARYLGTEATDEQLMQTFVDMEAGEISALSAKEQIKKLMAEVEQTYGPGDHDHAELDHEVIMSPRATLHDDFAWQDNHFDMFINDAGLDSKLEIARNLLITTSLNAEQVAGITGVDIALLEEWDEDSDEEYSVTQTVMTTAEESFLRSASAIDPPFIGESTGGGVTITSTQLAKAIMLSPEELETMNEMAEGGADVVGTDLETAATIMKKIQAAIQLAPSMVKRTRVVSFAVEEKVDAPGQPTRKAAVSVSVSRSRKKSEAFPRKYRVVISPGAMIKSGIELSSSEVARLPIGTVVTISEIQDRRGKMIDPVEGWCSLVARDGRIILQPEMANTPEMAIAIRAARTRQTKQLVLKSITTLEDETVVKILEKSDWNLRRAIEAFYIAKYKTAEYLKNGPDGPEFEEADSNTLDPSSAGLAGASGKKRKGWWKKWKKYVVKSQDM